ncbi:hypothetical protein BHE74_00023842 [Ensete ventricosum]|nr:hypothetical protein GW17_00016960 [Ensete ventricosum]RWW68631.1 hypothetical protein BHE74_00023842 [Ensete ventricosum]RZR76223.1 hypothetical protein BHM03_00000876 [Ensete ventricosum]
MEGMEWKGCVYRIRKCVFDLLSMEEDLIDDDEDTWELMGSSLRLKSTFLYCDLNQVISRAKDERKKFLTDLANKLFCYMEQVILLLSIFKCCLFLIICGKRQLDHAVKSRSISLTQIRYNDTAHVLQEVMAALVPSL